MMFPQGFARLTAALTLISAFSPSVQAQENTTIKTALSTPVVARDADRAYTGAMIFSLLGRQFDDEVVKSRFSRAIIQLEFTGKYRNWLRGKFAAAQLFTTGAASNLYAVTEGSTGTNGAFIDEATATLIPFSTLNGLEGRLTAGIVRAGINPVATIMQPGSWMGLNLELEQKGEDGKIVLAAAQSTPAASTTSNRIVDEDTLPLFTTGTLNGEMTVLKSNWKVGAAATSFIFTDPSAQSAADSQKIGSTVIGNGKGGILYAYDFRGAEYAASVVREDQGGSKLTLRASTLTNEMAPTESNKGETARVEYKRAGNEWNVTGSLTGFRIESDALPATYTSATNGFSNRIGTTTGLKIENRKQKFALTASVTQARVLNLNAMAATFQADREIYSLGAEVNHELF